MNRRQVWMLRLAVIVFISLGTGVSVVNPQTTVPPDMPDPATTLAGGSTTTLQGLPDIVIEGCPPVVQPAYVQNSFIQVAISWIEPFSPTLGVDRSTNTPPGTRFGVGVSEVSYTFVDTGGNKAYCVFNVTVQLQCPVITDQPCNNGVCVPRSTSCDGFNDCGDNAPWGSDEGFGECPRNQQCSSASAMLYNACAVPTLWTDAREAVSRSVRGTGNIVFKFTAPSDATDRTYLFRVRLNVTDIIDLQSKELVSPTIFINISLPASVKTTTVRAAVPRGLSAESFVELDLRQPLVVRPSEEIEVTMEFDENILDSPPPFPAESRNRSSVGVRFSTFTAGCDNRACLDAFVTWKTLATFSSRPDVRPCGIPEQNEILYSIYDSCLAPPTFGFVSPSVSSFLEDNVVLICVGHGVFPPSVMWYDSNMNVVASGFGSAALDVTVSFQAQSFTCVLEERISYEETVTVSYWGEECENLYLEVRGFPFQMETPCLSATSLSGSSSGRSPFSPEFSFSIGQAVVAHRFTMDASALNPGNIDEGNPDYGDSGPSAGGVVLPVRLTVSLPLRRKRRGVNTDIYSREFRNLYVPPFGDVTLDLDPPVSLAANSVILFSVTVLQEQRFFESPPPPPARLEVLSCAQGNNSFCDDFLPQWSQKQQDFEESGCPQRRNLQLLSYQICLGSSTAVPKVVTHPRSVDVVLRPSNNEVEEGTAIMTCYIENAVTYEWYKVAPVPGRTLVKSGSTLSFTITQFDNPRVQGSYMCVGKGGTPYDDISQETRPATLTVDGFSMFKVMAAIDRVYTPNLTNPNSTEYTMLWNELRSHLDSALGEFGMLSTNLDLVGFTPGSVVADIILYVGQSNMDDGKLADFIAGAIRDAPSETLTFLPGSIMVLSLVTCLGEEVDGVTFPQTKVGGIAESVEQCPLSTSKAGMPLGTRACAGDVLSPAYWLEPVLVDCTEGDNVNILLGDLSRVNVTSDNVREVAEETVILTSNYTGIDASGIMATADILEKIVIAGNSSVEVAGDIVRVVNNILQVDRETYEDLGEDTSPSRIIRALEDYITALQMSEVAGNLTVVESYVAVSAVLVPQDSLQLGLGFAAVPLSPSAEPQDPLTDEDVVVYYVPSAVPVAEVKASIRLPPEILNFISGGDSVPISFFFYQSTKLFRSPKLRAAARPSDKFSRALGSYVIAATVEGVRVQDLPMEAPVVSAFLPLNVSNPGNTVNGSECVFWDFNLNGGFGDWSTEGCRQVTINNSRTVCHCDHLTSFAVIVDIYGNQDNVVLSIISKIGCAVSLVALIITIITYLAVKKLRTKRPQQILVSFCFALAGLYLVFLVGIEATSPQAGCIIVAVLIHYFTLASIAWMAVEATNMYLLFVKILNANVSHFLIKASIAAWGLPLLVVIIILAVDHTNYLSTNYCFLRPGNAFYFGQILLIGLVLLFNFIIFTLVMRQLTCARKGINSTTDRSKHQETMRRLQNAVAISVLLGLTWVFGLLSLVQTANFAFQVLFCVFNSLQGLMIFLLFCVRQQEVRQAWVDFARGRCGKDRAADYSKGAGTRSQDRANTGEQGTLPLTHRSTDSTATS
ncbi:uncharacterized protein LOC110986402 [Acanthaster planci]|uniref:Uncharacterized protein LOC110986402 n=1 Tax=Acanthaster planci TaxID=133434 RepID=A0A8B7ZKU9_ACAPL|nr:uncharacterized protein LOC110986402 [Acanthaster planci]